MEICAFILMASLPIAWIAVGCLLVIVALIAVTLYLLRAREVAALKKEVSDLRDTIRMMRYEEANLARMLHTANKPAPQSERVVDVPVSGDVEEKVEVIAPIVEESVEEPLLVQEELVVESAIEETSAVEDQVMDFGEGVVEESVEVLTEEEVAQEDAVEEPSSEELSPVEDEELQEAEEQEEAEEFDLEELVAEAENEEEYTIELPADEAQMPEVVVEEASEPMGNEDEEFEESAGSVVEPVAEPVEESVADVEIEEEPAVEAPMPVATPVQKQSINERRPAIPTDLFSAWFAENEEDFAEEPAEVESRQVVEPSVSMESDVVEESIAPIEQPVEEVEPLDVPVPEASVESVVEEQSAPEQVEGEKSEEADDALSTSVEEPASEPSGVVLSKDDERFCRKLERIVNTRLRNPNLNVDTIAAQFGIGRTNFYRKVRELTGMSPNDYLRKSRMERAAELLRTTELPVSDVCAQVGIPDAQYFSKVFKVYFELTPTAYREKNQANQ